MAAQLARDTWLQAPYTDANYLSTGIQQHPGNGVAVAADGSVLVAERFSVSQTADGGTPSGVKSLTPGMRQAYGGTTGTTPDINRPKLT